MNAIRVSLVAAIAALGLLVPQAVAITGGQVDQNNTYSNVGALVVVPSDGSPPYVGFSGTLIHPRVLLTAGHCSEFIVPYPEAIPFLRVSFGTDALDPRTWLEIETAITHPGYDGNVMWNNPHMNDVGVVILKKPVNIRKVPLARLPYKGLLDDLNAAGLLRDLDQGGVPFTVVGYGSTFDWPPPTEVGPDGLRRFAQSEYLALTESWLFTQQNPAATDGGGTGVGDSGGPTFWVDGDGSLVLVALTSRGNMEYMSTNIAWRVDIPETLDFSEWVLNQVKQGRL